jgi:CRISPR-associated protein (TIGR02710 family)
LRTLLDQAVALHDQADKKQQFEIYKSQVFPPLRDWLMAQPAPETAIELLLVPVSNQHVPILAAAAWKPTTVLALCSPYSAQYLPMLQADIERMGIRFESEVHAGIDNDATKLYEAIQGYVRPLLRGSDNPHIAVDLTGGTSVMSVSAAMAVSLIGGRLLYIQSQPKPENSAERQVGSETPCTLTDPYQIFGDLEAQRGAELFAAHDYPAAAEVFSKLAQRVSGKRGQRYQADALLSEMYAAWDAFGFAVADQHAEQLRHVLDELPLGVQSIVIEQQAVLKQLATNTRQIARAGGPSLDLLRDPLQMLPLLGSLYYNALRRETQERFDVAALLRYRCLELLSQQRLATYAILTERYDDKEVKRRFPEADNTYRQVERNLFGRERGLPYGDKLALLNGYMLLAALNDPFVQLADLDQIRRKSHARNTSMLAHGYTLIDETSYRPFATLVDALIARFFTLIAHDQAAWSQTYRFVQPFEVTP